MDTLGGILISILSGAGGAALLDLYLKPKITKRQTARLLLTEIQLNTKYLKNVVSKFDDNPRNIPIDFFISISAWDKVLSLISVLEFSLIDEIFLLYIRYSEMSKYVEKALSHLKSLEESFPLDIPNKIDQENLEKCVHHYHSLSVKCMNTGESIALKLQEQVNKKIFFIW